jgi:hypothetical protein
VWRARDLNRITRLVHQRWLRTNPLRSSICAQPQEHLALQVPENEVDIATGRPLLGWQTDCMVRPASVHIHPRAGYTLVQTPACPGYWFGNYLFLWETPRPASVEQWVRVWQRKFVGRTGVNTVVLQWEVDKSAPAWAGTKEPLSVEGCAEPLRVTSTSICVLESPQPPRHGAPVAVRPIETEEEWEGVLALALEEIEPTDEKHRQFSRWRLGEYRRQVQEGGGRWWGGFGDGELWGAAGFFWRDGLARFQDVATAQTVRRRGVCTHLVYAVATDFLHHCPNGQVVIAAESGSQAESVYSRLGFREVSRQWSLMAKRA